MKEKKLIRFDWAMKRLLRNKANFGILEGLLSELLGEDIKIDHLIESESNKESAKNRMNRLDILVQKSKEEQIIIEVQVEYLYDFLSRMLFGTSKLVVDNMDENMEYGFVKKVISVNIVYFDLGHGADYIYHGTTIFKGINQNDILTLSGREKERYHLEKPEQIYPEYYIIKVNQFNDVAKNTLEEWVNFLKTEEVKEGTKAKGLNEAKEKLDKMKLSVEEREEYDRDIDAWRVNSSVIKSNFFEGRLEGIKEMAKNCLKNGLSIEMTSKITGLTEDEIRDIN